MECQSESVPISRLLARLVLRDSTSGLPVYPGATPKNPQTGECFDYSSVMVLRSLELSSCDVRWSCSVDVPGN